MISEMVETIEIFNPYLFHEKASEFDNKEEILEALVFLELQKESANEISSRYVDSKKLQDDIQRVIFFLENRLKQQ